MPEEFSLITNAKWYKIISLLVKGRRGVRGSGAPRHGDVLYLVVYVVPTSGGSRPGTGPGPGRRGPTAFRVDLWRVHSFIKILFKFRTSRLLETLNVHLRPSRPGLIHKLLLLAILIYFIDNSLAYCTTIKRLTPAFFYSLWRNEQCLFVCSMSCLQCRIHHHIVVIEK